MKMAPERSRSSSSSGVSSGEVEVMAVVKSTTEGLTEPSEELPKIYLQANHGDTDSSEKKKEEIRIGSDYQANIPEDCASDEEFLGETLVWSAAAAVAPEDKLNEFLEQAVKSKDEEEALQMLLEHRHDTEAALNTMANATSKPAEWTATDIFLYERAFMLNGKSFQKIKRVFPSKSIASIVEFYYTRKKKLELKDKRNKKLKMIQSNKVRRSQGYCRKRTKKRNPGLINPTSTSAGTRKPRTSMRSRVKPLMSCENCATVCIDLNSSPMGNFCVTCYLHWRRTGEVRPIQESENFGGSSRVSRSQLKELQKYQQSPSKAVEQPSQEFNQKESKQDSNQKSNEEASSMESNKEEPSGTKKERNEEGSSIDSIEKETSMVEKLEPFLREYLSSEASHEDCNHGQFMVISYFDQTFQEFSDKEDNVDMFMTVQSVPESSETN